MHCTKNPISVFPEMKLHGFVPVSYIHVSVSDWYIPRIRMPTVFGCNKIGRPNLRIYKLITDTWMWKLGDILLENSEALRFHFCEYINRNQTFILDSHLPFICRVPKHGNRTGHFRHTRRVPSNALCSAMDLNFDIFFLMISSQGEQLSI